MSKSSLLLVLTWLLQALLFASLPTPLAWADTMMIMPYSDVWVSEEDQAAIIAWNGTHEYLLLTVNARAVPLVSRSGRSVKVSETLAVQILPLPSVPEVKEGEEWPFKDLSSTLFNRLMRKARLTHFYGPAAASGEDISLVFYEEVGVHNLAVIEVENASELVDWILDFYSGKGIPVEEQTWPSGPVEAIASRYVRRGYRYFVVDVVMLDRTAKTISPLVFVFECDYVYYPLYISSLAIGDTSIKLFVIARYWLTQEEVRHTGLRVVLKDVLSYDDLIAISEDICHFMGDRPAKVTELVYEGPARKLRSDLEAVPKPTYEELRGYAYVALVLVPSTALVVVPAGLVAKKPRRPARANSEVVLLASALALTSSFVLMPLALALLGPPYYAGYQVPLAFPIALAVLAFSSSTALALEMCLPQEERRALLPALLVASAALLALASYMPAVSVLEVYPPVVYFALTFFMGIVFLLLLMGFASLAFRPPRP